MSARYPKLQPLGQATVQRSGFQASPGEPDMAASGKIRWKPPRQR